MKLFMKIDSEIRNILNLQIFNKTGNIFFWSSKIVTPVDRKVYPAFHSIYYAIDEKTGNERN